MTYFVSWFCFEVMVILLSRFDMVEFIIVPKWFSAHGFLQLSINEIDAKSEYGFLSCWI